MDNQEINELKELKALLETAVLPSLVQMIEAVGEQSYQSEQRGISIEKRLRGVESAQPDIEKVNRDVGMIVSQLENLSKEGSANEEGFQILTNVLSSFGEKFGKLVNTNNELVRTQKQQIERMENVIFSFEENTARLDTLTLAIQSYMEEQSQWDNYTKEEPVFSAIEDQVKRISEKEQKPTINDTDRLVQSTPIKTPTSSIYTEITDKINRLEENKKTHDD